MSIYYAENYTWSFTHLRKMVWAGIYYRMKCLLCYMDCEIIGKISEQRNRIEKVNNCPHHAKANFHKLFKFNLSD